MKIIKYIKYCLLLSVVFSFSSCLFEDDNLFDKSPAQRLNLAIENSNKVLRSAPNGWTMEYFATPESGGYTFLMKFADNGFATIGAQNEYFTTFTTEESFYEVIGDTGPVLSFHTYNKVFHMFANPENPAGLGLKGDYEFIIKQLSDDVILLKGKKRGTKIIMRKFSGEDSWESYSDNLYKMNELLFSRHVPKLSFTIGEKEYVAYDASTHVFSLLAKGDDEIVGERISMPFIVTPNGIRLYDTISEKEGEDGLQIEYLNVNMEKGALSASETENIYIKGPEPLPFFVDSLNWVGGRLWKTDKDNFGGEFATVYATIVENTKTAFNQDFESFSFVYSTKQRGRAVSFKTNKNEGFFNFETPNITVDNQITLKNKGTSDNNAKTFLSRVGGMDRFLELLTEGSFSVTSDSPICPTVLKFVSNTNADNWFQVSMPK